MSLSVPKTLPRLPGGRLAFERAIRRSDLPAPARHVALTLATWADIESGVIPERFQPSISTLAEATGLSTATVKRHLSVLEAARWLLRDRPEISRARAEHARTQYALVVPDSAEGHGSEGAKAWLTASQGHGSGEAGAWLTASHKSSRSSGESPPPSPPPPPAGPDGAEAREGGREDAPPTGQEQQAAEALARAVAGIPQLVLGEKEIGRLVPLVVPWLERATPEQLRTALTAGLPPVVGSPAGLVRTRLLDKLPPVAIPGARTGGTPVPPSWAERQAALDAALGEGPAAAVPAPVVVEAARCPGHGDPCGRPAVSHGLCRRHRVAAQQAADGARTG